MADASGPDFSFITDDMTLSEKNDAYRDAYLQLWEQGTGVVQALRDENESLKQEKIYWQGQERFGIKVIEHLRKLLAYYQNKYPNDRPPFANDNESDAIMKQYENAYNNNNNNNNINSNINSNNDYNNINNINNISNNDDYNIDNNVKNDDYLNVFSNNTNSQEDDNNTKQNGHSSHNLRHELYLERRQSEYLRQECDDLQNELQALEAREKEIVTVANHAWEQQLYNVFEQIAEQGHDIGSLKINFDVANDESANSNSKNANVENAENKTGKTVGKINLTGDPNTVSQVQGMRKNLVRLYTKTDWNPNDLKELKEEMISQMQELHNETMGKMTHNPNIMLSEEFPVDYANSETQAKADAAKYKKLYQECEAKLSEMQREYSQKMLENKEGIEALKDMMNERTEMLIQSKIDFINAVSSEMQHLRDMIKWYNPDAKYRYIIDKIVRYHDLAPGQGNALFQLIETAELPVSKTNENGRRISQIAQSSVMNDDQKQDY